MHDGTISKEFVDAYLAIDAFAIEERVALLQERFGLESATISAEVKPGLLGVNDIGRMQKKGPGNYAIEVIGSRKAAYITLHEFLHVWLEETGRTINVYDDMDPQVTQYIAFLKNMFDDYLIEREVSAQFNDHFARDVGETRGKSLMGGLLGMTNAPPLKTIMFALECQAVAYVYPWLKDEHMGKAARATCSVSNPEGFFYAGFLRHRSDIQPSEYPVALSTLDRMLAGSGLGFKDGVAVVPEPGKVEAFVKRMEETYAGIRAAMALADEATETSRRYPV